MRKYIAIATCCFAAVLISACRVSKDTAVSKADLPTGFRTNDVNHGNSIAMIQWKDFFTDTSLQKLIGDAILKNYDMQVALKNIQMADLVYKQSKLGNIPSADLQITAGSTRYSGNSLDGLQANQYLGVSHIEDYNANIGLSWEADFWGKIRNKKKAALAAYLQTTEAKKLIQTNIVTAVATGYYNLLMLDDQLAIAHKNVLLNDSVLNIIHFQYEAGQVTSLAVQQAEAQKLAIQQLIPQFEQEIEIQENAISILSGQFPDAILRNSSLETTAISDSISTGVPADMISNRPDVKEYELALDAANAKVGIAKGSMYPTLTITAVGGLNSFRASDWFNIPASLFGSVAGGVVAPLFEKNQLKTQYKIAEVEREKTVIQFRESVLNAVGDVSNALITIKKLNEEQSIASDRVATLKRAIADADMLFKNGLANYLEVITAQGNVLQSELELATIKRSQLAAKVQLYGALGGGWR